MEAELIDKRVAARQFWAKHPPLREGPSGLADVRTFNQRKAVWDVLVDGADDTGRVTMTMSQIRLAAGRPARQKSNIRQAVVWLRRASLLTPVQGEEHTYRLGVPGTGGPQPSPATPSPSTARDPRLAAFDQRAAAWSPQRRRSWRAVWRAVLACAGTDGTVVGDVATLADLAYERYGASVTDETVGRILMWSVASGLTEQIRPGRTPLLRLVHSPRRLITA